MAGRGMGAATQGGGCVSSGARNRVTSKPSTKIKVMMKDGGDPGKVVRRGKTTKRGETTAAILANKLSPAALEAATKTGIGARGLDTPAEREFLRQATKKPLPVRKRVKKVSKAKKALKPKKAPAEKKRGGMMYK